MKQLMFILASALLLVVILIIGVFSYFPNKESSQAVIVVPVDPTVIQLEERLVEQDAAYRAKATALDASLQQQQLDFQIKRQSLNDEIAAAQRQLQELQSEKQDLLKQIEQLESDRAEQLASYQTELQQVDNEYGVRWPQLQAQLADLQAKLAKANGQLLDR
jgi:peptidoglycan hydrolase CwlO-like protein